MTVFLNNPIICKESDFNFKILFVCLFWVEVENTLKNECICLKLNFIGILMKFLLSSIDTHIDSGNLVEYKSVLKTGDERVYCPLLPLWIRS